MKHLLYLSILIFLSSCSKIETIQETLSPKSPDHVEIHVYAHKAIFFMDVNSGQINGEFGMIDQQKVYIFTVSDLKSLRISRHVGEKISLTIYRGNRYSELGWIEKFSL